MFAPMGSGGQIQVIFYYLNCNNLWEVSGHRARVVVSRGVSPVLTADVCLVSYLAYACFPRHLMARAQCLEWTSI